MATLTRLFRGFIFFTAINCGTNSETVRWEPIPPRVLDGFQKAYDICEEPFSQENRIYGESPKDFAKRLCDKYGFGNYINPGCDGNNFYNLTCQDMENKTRACTLVYAGPSSTFCNDITDYCGEC